MTQPNEARARKYVGLLFLALVLVAVIWLLFAWLTDDRISDAECKLDLYCWANRHWIDAEVSCKQLVLERAKHDHRWLGGRRFFDSYHWRDSELGILTYKGSKAQFQNAFGAWHKMQYQCDYDPEKQTVRLVELSER